MKLTEAINGLCTERNAIARLMEAGQAPVVPHRLEVRYSWLITEISRLVPLEQALIRSLKMKPDTVSSKEWTRQQPLEWRLTIAKLCKQSTVTAENLDGDVEMWAALKDEGICRFIYQGDYVEGIGAFNGGYYIEYGGIVNEPAFVSGDTEIKVEWL